MRTQNIIASLKLLKSEGVDTFYQGRGLVANGKMEAI